MSLATQLRPPDAPTRYRLVFDGRCLLSHNPQAVRVAVVAALRLDPEHAARLFSGKPMVIRRHLDASAAKRHVERFARLGAVLQIEPDKPQKPRKPAAAAPLLQKFKPWEDEFAPSAVLLERQPLRRWRWPLLARWMPLWLGLSALSITGALAFWFVLVPTAETHALPEAAASSTLKHPWANALQSPAADSPASPAMPAAAGSSPTHGQPPTTQLPLGMTAPALVEHQQRYLPAQGFKAYALSNDGAWGWHAGAKTEAQARDMAMERCMAAMAAGDYGCRVVDVAGRWQE